MAQYLLGIDIGSHESKGVLTDTSGKLIAQDVRKHEMQHPKPGHVEHDVEAVWWGEFASLCKSLVEMASVDAKDVAGVAVSAAFGMVPVDENCTPLRAGGIMYGVDTRSVAEIDELNKRLGEERILQRCGNPLSTQQMGTKVLWLKNNEPDIFAAAHMFLPSSSFIVARLTGAFVIDHLHAGFFGPLYDLQQQCWGEDLCEGIVEIDRLPKIMWASEIAGTVTQKAAAETGLAVGTPVTVGTSDVAAEALSIGVTSPGETMMMYGSTAWITLLVEEPVLHKDLWASPFVFPGVFCLHGGTATSGSMTRWMRDNIASEMVSAEGEGQPEAYTRLTELAEQAPPGAGGLVVLPYFSGERSPINDPYAKGMIFGLQLHHDRSHLYRAALEGVGYSINHTLQVMREAGADPKLMSAVGGGTKSKIWLQSVSDITGVPQEVPMVTLGASYGNAFLAGCAAGLIESPEKIRDWVAVRERISPNGQNADVYAGLMDIYLKLYERNADLMHRVDNPAR
ncbi:MAG: FGGY-family carbohydrate kinase [Rhizobiaceae bacterium]|nr:FGGY-family carbohydrate kinase [Rhizobiaceae bacterium]